MPPRLTWTNLIPGLIALFALVIIGAAVLKFAGVGKVRGETVRVNVITDQARGLMAGSEVWLDGQKAGVVHHIGFRPPSADTLHRVVIAIDVRDDAAARMRHDSRVSLQSGGTLAGPIVVFIESGTPAGQPIRPEDTLRALAASDGGAIMDRAQAAAEDLPSLLSDAQTVMTQARSGDGTLGAFLSRGLPAGEMRALRRNVATLRARMSGANTATQRETLMQRATSAMARADSVQALVVGSRSSLGRFRRDSTLMHSVGEIARELSALQRELADSPGTLGRLKGDSALIRSVADARAEMTLLFADIRRRPLRYIHF